MKTKITVTEAAATIQRDVDAVGFENYTSGLPVRIARRVSKGDKILALAAYLKWDMPSMRGQTDSDWIGEAKLCAKILRASK